MKKLLISLFIASNLTLSLYAQKLIVGATPIPHAEIIEFIKPELKKAGYDVEIKEFNDYVIPNYALENGEIDFHFAIVLPYMKEFNAKNGTHMFPVVGVHIEPLGIYSSKLKDLKELKKGAKVAIPNDVSTETRALKLLQKAGLITLRDVKDGGFLTSLDIIKNDKSLQITTLEPASVPRTLKDADIAIINMNYALAANLNPKRDSLALEGGESPYVNYLIVKEGNENLQSTKVFKEIITSPKVRQFIEKKYDGAIISAF